MTPTLARACALSLLVPFALPAQEDPAGDPLQRAQERLQQALETTGQLNAAAFRAENRTRIWNVQQGKLIDSASESVRGGWSEGIRFASCHKGDDELVLHGGRMIAREAKGPWHLRRDLLAKGAPVPFLFDPRQLFAVMAALELKVARAEVGSWLDRPVEILTVTTGGAQAAELAWSGVLPITVGVANPFAKLLAARTGKKFRPTQPKLTIDLAIYVDPATKRVQAIEVRSYQESAAAGLAGAMVAAGGGAPPAEGEKRDEEPAAELEFRDALPVREIEGKSVMELEVQFTGHDEVELPKLDDKARALLGLR